jgi:MarR family transcriptional regulator, temperature-dependent positive regulator of motility
LVRALDQLSRVCRNSSRVLTIVATMAYPDADTPLLLLLALTSRHLTDALQAHLLDAGFEDHRVVHHHVMAHVRHDGIRLTELAELGGITKQAMSELVIDLERLGYLERSGDPLDGRAKLIRFTDKGRSAVDAAMSAFDHMDDVLAAQLGAETLHTLRVALLATLGTPLSLLHGGRPVDHGRN